MEKKTAGRKQLPLEQKKSQVNFYLTPEEEKRMRDCLIEIRRLNERELSRAETRAGEAIESQNTVDDALHVIAHKAGREQKEQICKDVAACIMMNYGDVYVPKTIRAHCQFLTSYMEKPETALNIHEKYERQHTMKDGRILTFEKNRYYIEARETETK